MAATDLLVNSRPPAEPPPGLLAVADLTLSSRPPAEPPPAFNPTSNARCLNSFDDDESFGSSSEVADLLGAEHDINAPLRWASQLPRSFSSNTANICTAQVVGLPDGTPDDDFSKCFPPGSFLDPRRPPSPTDVRDFPELTVHPWPARTNTDPTSSGPDQVVPIRCSVRAIGLQPGENVGIRILSVCTGADSLLSAMVDGGANIGIAPNEDALVGVKTISPVKVGLALSSDGVEAHGMCRRMGYLPVDRLDGTLHYQPMLVHESATDIIISPQSIVESSPDFHSWTQTGFSDGRPGSLIIRAANDSPLVDMILHRRNGLYYFDLNTACLDDCPAHVQSYRAHTLNHTIMSDSDSDIQPTLAALRSLTASRSPLVDELDGLQRPGSQFHPLLPPLSEDGPFSPYMDPVDGVPFDPSNDGTAYFSIYRTETPGGDDEPKLPRKSKYRMRPVGPAQQLESELWAARLGFCGEWQLDVIPACADGLPTQFDYHPFRYIDHKEQARVRRQAAGRVAERVEGCGQCFYLDFGFMRASAKHFGDKDDGKDSVVRSFDGFNSYLAIVDEHSRYGWVFLCASKDPPIEEMSAHLQTFGLKTGGILRCDQGGELAKCSEFITEMKSRHGYVVEPTGADSPSQNGGVERWNQTWATTVRALLYGAALEAKYWSAALLHAVYLHNRLVVASTRRTPFEAWYGRKPNLRHLKMFGSRVCVKQPGKRNAKLDRNDYRGIFLGYTATDLNIRYIDLDSGVVKTSHHASFDEAWYLQPSRPPAAQLLYNLGLVNEEDLSPPAAITPVEVATYPPPPMCCPSPPKLDIGARQIPIPFRLTPTPPSLAAAAAKVTTPSDPYAGTTLQSNPDALVVDEYGITKKDITQIYVSSHPYREAFEDEMDLRRFNNYNKPTGGMKFKLVNGRLILEHMEKSSPGNRIHRWRSRLRGAWLRQINDTVVASPSDVARALAALVARNEKSCTLVFSHPAINHGLTNSGIPQVNIDQLNPRLMFQSFGLPDEPPPQLEDTTLSGSPIHVPKLSISTSNHRIAKVRSGDVFNYVTTAMKLTRGKLLKDPDWSEWQQSEWKQLDQYYDQGMFGKPVRIDSTEAVFNLVWTYVVKELDKRKKARCTCDGSTRSGQVRILDHTYANCVDQTSSRLFYALAAAENLIVYGADVSNAFAEAPAPKQGFYVRPDRAFRDWWEHKFGEVIPPDFVIPVLSAMQGHPESPRLWEKHADKILRALGLTPTHHEPCLYSGVINDERVLFMRQVDDFAVAVPSQTTADILFDMIDDALTFPLKRMGLVDLFNGVDVLQTRYYVKISVETYLNKIMPKHLASWMKTDDIRDRPTPLPTRSKFMEHFLSQSGDPDPKVQANLAKEYGFAYRSGIGELIYAMITARPDLAFATVCASQNSACPADIHYHGVRHILKYLWHTKSDGIYFWRTEPNMNLPLVEPPTVTSNQHDLLMDGRPNHDALDLHAYMDATWASCLKTRRSYGGHNVRLAGGPVGYKTKLQPTVADSSTAAEYIEAHDCGKMVLFVRSILWDLGVPQCAATIAYEDNDAAIAMANAQKPTSRTRHLDIKYHVLAEWTERDLLTLERVDTTQNQADHYTKQLTPILFYRHTDYIMGKVPPTYSPCFQQIFQGLPNSTKEEHLRNTSPIRLPEKFQSLPAAAAAAKLFATWSKITQSRFLD